MAGSGSSRHRPWPQLSALLVAAVIAECVLFLLALEFQVRSCSQSADRLLLVIALAIPPLAYLLFDRSIVRTLIVAFVCLLPIGILGPGLVNAPNESKRKETMARMQQIGNALDAYAVDNNAYPAAHNVAGLSRALRKPLPSTDAWCEPFSIESGEKHDSIAGHGFVYRDGYFDAGALAGESLPSRSR